MRHLALVLLVLFSGSVLAGTQYYVDCTGGDDADNGLAETDEGGGVGPWLTLEKVNDTVTGTGDDVAIKRGTTCLGDGNGGESLYVDWTGSSGDTVVISAYDSGDKPVIQPDGANLALRILTAAASIDYVTVQDLELDCSVPEDSAASCVLVEDEAFSNITLQRLDIDCGVNHGGNGIFLTRVDTYNILDNAISSCWSPIKIYGAPSLPKAQQAENGLIDNNVLSCDGDDSDGITLHSNGGTTDCVGDNHVISNNIVNGPCGENSLDLQCKDANSWYPSNITVSDNQFLGATQADAGCDNPADCSGSPIGVVIMNYANVVFERNYHNEGAWDAMIRVQGTQSGSNTGIVIRNSLFYESDEDSGSDGSHILHIGSGGGSVNATDLEFVNNTVYTDSETDLLVLVEGTTPSGVTVSNNIFMDDGGTVDKVVSTTSGGNPTTIDLTVQNNIFYVNGWDENSTSVSDNGTNRTWANYESTYSAKDLDNNIWENPDLTNPPTDMHIDETASPTSPAIDAGIAAVCPTEDYDENTRSDGQCDIGAYEVVTDGNVVGVVLTGVSVNN